MNDRASLRTCWDCLVLVLAILFLIACASGGCGNGTSSPSVDWVCPSEDDTWIPPTTIISIIFSKCMNPSTINRFTIILRDSAGIKVYGTITYEDKKSYYLKIIGYTTFVPSSPLAFSTQYTVTVTTGVTDLDGNALAAEYNSTFTTGPPGTGTWRAISTTDAPSPRVSSTAIWTGLEMIVWGGDASTSLNTGGRYDPVTDTWQPISTTDAPLRRTGHTAIWTGSEMIVMGGEGKEGDDDTYLNTGGRYDPVTDTWTATCPADAPYAHGIYANSAIWSGAEIIIYGGYAEVPLGLNEGSRYDPATDKWTTISVPDLPPRSGHTAVWTGTEMIIWGGYNNMNSTIYDPNQYGGRYNPFTDTWEITSPPDSRLETSSHTAVWTGTEMIIWGGESRLGLDLHGIYTP